MIFQALLVTKDEQTSSVLAPVLAEFELEAKSCSYTDALTRLTEQKFDAVIVDFDDPHNASLVFQNAGAAGHVVTVALLNDKKRVRSVFGAGANFVLYKPLSAAKAKATLRAAIALIKRERRSSFRVPVQVAVQLRVQGGAEMEGILLDISEEGMDVLSAQTLYPTAPISARFQLPESDFQFEVQSQVAWANPNGQSGVRFVDMGESAREALKSWFSTHAPEMPPDEPEPVAHCQLTDLSTGGCYVETESPFPERSEIVLNLKVANVEVQAEGTVRVMHPGFGMGIEFASRTPQQREQVSGFINLLMSRPGTLPELSITPRALAGAKDTTSEDHSAHDDFDDPLLELLRGHESFGQEEFLEQLRKQRNSEAVTNS
ncbi:MAG TPA: PilZ domain-containing protein [Terriglobales bacterium]|jgi:CheY-like chemotaxis protein